MQRIFPQTVIGLVACREYSHELALDWSRETNIPTNCNWIGRVKLDTSSSSLGRNLGEGEVVAIAGRTQTRDHPSC
jgi:hypothetical protein